MKKSSKDSIKDVANKCAVCTYIAAYLAIPVGLIWIVASAVTF